MPYYSEVYKRTREKCDPLLWPTFPFGDDPVRRFQHFVDLAKDPGTKPDLGAGDMGSVNLVSYDPITKNLGEGNFVYQNSYDTINTSWRAQTSWVCVRPCRSLTPAFCAPPWSSWTRAY